MSVVVLLDLLDHPIDKGVLSEYDVMVNEILKIIMSG